MYNKIIFVVLILASISIYYSHYPFEIKITNNSDYNKSEFQCNICWIYNGTLSGTFVQIQENLTIKSKVSIIENNNIWSRGQFSCWGDFEFVEVNGSLRCMPKF